MRPPQFRYFLAYTFTDNSGNSGFGNTEVTRSRLIRTTADVQQIGAELAEADGHRKVVVLSFQQFPNFGTER